MKDAVDNEGKKYSRKVEMRFSHFLRQDDAIKELRKVWGIEEMSDTLWGSF